MANRDDILAHEAGTGKELVHEIAIAKLTGIISIVGHAIPWLNTHKRSMLATRTPDADSRCLEIYGNDRLVALTKQFHMVKLAVIEDDRIILECVLCNIPNTFVRLHYLVTALVNTPLYITEDADRAHIIEPQRCFHGFAGYCTRNIECRMSANLEVDGLVISVLYMPYNMNLIVLKLIAHTKIEVEWIVLERLCIVVKAKDGLGITTGYQPEISVAGKAMTRQMIFFSIDTIGVMPHTAH